MNLKGKAVFLTGATGFIGSHLARALADAGTDLRLLVRRTSETRWIDDVPHRRFIGDLADGADLREALDGVEFVFHLSGILRAWRRSDYLRGNVDATRNLIAAMRERRRPPRLIVASSLAAAGPSPDGKARVEDDPPSPVGSYGESKLLGERAALEAKGDLDVVVLRPPAVYGPRETDLLSVCRSVKLGLLVQFGRSEKTMSMIYCRDLIEAFLGAAARAPAGSTYFVSHPEILTWSEILDGIAKALGRRGRRIAIPEEVLPALARAGEVAARLTGKASLINRERTREWRYRHWVCNPSRAQREWGFLPTTSFREGIRETLDWYRGEGWL